MHALLIILAGTVSLVSSQSVHQPQQQFDNQQYHQTSRQAAILSDARYLAGDGTFGAAYSQEDGVEFKEESDANGDRRGSYSYVDPNGQRHTVTYTAGKNGFQATGDHIPSAAPPVPPQPEYVPLAQYNPPDYQAPQQLHQHYQQEPQSPEYTPQSIYQSEPVAQLQPRPHYQPQAQPHYRYQPREPPPYQPAYQAAPELQSIPSYDPQAQHYQPTSRPPPRYNAIPTPAPHRFYPPGKLNFNRTPDGFSYTFSKS